MPHYYSENLSSRRLQRCYELASPRIQRYLAAEVEHVRTYLRPHSELLELGCGYGRVVFALAGSARRVVGIDLAQSSIDLARELAQGRPEVAFETMDATALGFEDASFDVSICIQNGICAFHADEDRLLGEALRVTRPGGVVLFSTYAPGIWEQRLEWFERQAAEGLIGPIDRQRTGQGTIVCTDGFSSGTYSRAAFTTLARRHRLEPVFTEVDGSSLFMALTRTGHAGS